MSFWFGARAIQRSQARIDKIHKAKP